MANTDVMNFIQSYKSLNLLWDTLDKNYSNKLLRREALNELSKQYNLTIPEVKKKIKSLRSYFSKEYQRAKKTDNYVSAWFAYDAMSFIKDSVTDEDGSGTQQNMSFAIQNSKPGTSNILKRKKPLVSGGAVDAQTYGCIGRVGDVVASKDESSTFGDMVAFKLRRLSPRNRAIAQNRIGNLLFELEMEEFQMSSVQSASNSNSYSEAMTQSATVEQTASNANSYSEAMTQSATVGYPPQQANDSAHPDSLFVNDMCKVDMRS
ncbi:uncharacterized protein LOC111048153 isoform X2 [Nilaparvata lugens]|nr:uncharacterized protein LOC111048153 isoform X2 [Nilaparvata lugens]XP_039283683.1 uncharacterized protein LOC111048153 isoform X2 [Nilaparvata lugens]